MTDVITNETVPTVIYRWRYSYTDATKAAQRRYRGKDEVKQKYRERWQARYASDPEFRERHLKYAKEARERRKTSPSAEPKTGSSAEPKTDYTVATLVAEGMPSN